MCPNETHILLVPYGQGWRKLRKVVQALLNTTAVDSLLPLQNAEASQTMFQLARDPQNSYKHIRRYSTAVILASVFGQRGAEYDSSKVQALYHAQEQFTEILAPGATPPVDAFPFLKLIPGLLTPWKTRARAIRQEQYSLYFGLLNETRERIRKDSKTTCFMEKILRGQEKTDLSEEHIAYLGGILVSLRHPSCDG